MARPRPGSRAARERDAAAAIAGAVLAGEWQPAAMGRRAKRAVADRRRWPTDLAEIVVRAYPDRPADRPRELAAFVAACGPFRAAAHDHEHPLRARVWMAAPTRMGDRRWPVPVIDDLAALARWLGVTPDHLAWFADRRSMERTASDERLRHHHRRWVRKADGSGRLLEAPKRELKDLQRQVLRHILDRIPPHDAAHGFRPGRSALSAARPHAGRAVVLHLDLESFFACVGAGRVHGLFRLAGYPEPVAHTLAALCTTTTPRAVLRRAPPAPPGAGDDAIERRRRMLAHLAHPHLAQGAPTSPALANLVAHGLDRRMTGLARRLGATYTRYADDLVLSGDLPPATVTRTVRLVAGIVRDEGFRLHDGKSRLATSARRQTVLGLVVNERPAVPRDDYDRLRAVLHDAARRGPAVADRDGHDDFRAHLLGRISWVAATSPARAGRLAAAFAAIDWA
ncbi:MAG TPA: reverse transcriptase domain-containing protein [Acidimicrobiales bacterium]|nr:reverse transcriptase domain-containing protein [Acidimicrobiales bacterium]